MCQCLIKEKEIILLHTQLWEYHMISQISVWSFSRLKILPIPGMKISKISPQALGMAVWGWGSPSPWTLCSQQDQTWCSHGNLQLSLGRAFSTPLSNNNILSQQESQDEICHFPTESLGSRWSPWTLTLLLLWVFRSMRFPKETASPHIWCPALLLLAHCCLSSVGPWNSWVLRDYSLSTCCHAPNQGHPRKKRPTHLTLHISTFFALWPRSLG